MANENNLSDGPSQPDEAFNEPITADLYRQMFEAFSSTQPANRDLYCQKLPARGIPTLPPATQPAEGMGSMEGNKSSQVSTQNLYRLMFATHRIPTPQPPLQQPEGMDTLESSSNVRAPTGSLYREMFAAHGRPLPVISQDSAPAPGSTQDLYQQMFTAHNNNYGTDMAAAIKI